MAPDFNKKLLCLGVVACLLWLSLPILVVAQQPAAEDVIKINTDLVLLDAQVMDKKTGKAVSDLRRGDFDLLEDGVKQEIGYFSQDQLPLSILLLLDVSGSVRPIIEQVGEGALNALQRLKPGDEVAVMAFGTRSRLIHGFSRDRQLISRKISAAASAGDLGQGTFLVDALYQAALEMSNASNPASRRAIIVVTDNIAPTGGKNLVRSVMTELFESGTVVNGLIVRAAFGKVFNVLTLGQVHAVNSFTEETGGEVIGSDQKEVGSKLGEMLTRLRTRYTIGYRPTNASEQDSFRRVKLQVSSAAQKGRGKLVVHTKHGYYFRKKG